MTGLALALSEITLVVFTTLAPSGAVALALVCLSIIGRARKGASGSACEDKGEVARITRMLWVPILVTMVGLVASATHLGNPSNALYVLSGIGRSPLSTEVAAAVALLAAAGSFWLYGFAERPRRGLQRVWAAGIVVLAAVLVPSIAFAYSARTIPSWSTPLAPASLLLGSLVGGPVLARAVLCAARCCEPQAADGPARGARGVYGHLSGALLALATLALVAELAVEVAQGLALPSLHSSLTSADALVPSYWPMLAASGALQVAGLALAWRGEIARTHAPSRAPLPGLACVLVFAGLFVMRFAFYMMHLTSGL